MVGDSGAGMGDSGAVVGDSGTMVGACVVLNYLCPS